MALAAGSPEIAHERPATDPVVISSSVPVSVPAAALLRWLSPALVLILAGCSGDEFLVKTTPAASGLLVADGGLSPSDPGPLEHAIAWARVRDADQVVLHLANVDGDSLDQGFVDPVVQQFAEIALEPLEASSPGVFMQWEAPLPPRGEGRAWIFWFEAHAAGQSGAFPEEGAAGAVRVGAQTFDLDFDWPDWPPLSVQLPCRGDPSRVWDGAENEATLAASGDFQEINAPIWTPAAQATVLSNSEGIVRGAGVEIGGQAYFFPVAVLLHNEVSNHTLGGRRTSLTYCPLTDTAIHFDTGLDPDRLPKWHNYEPAGLFNSNLSVAIRGIPNSTVYNQMLGFGIQGAQAGACLVRLPSIMVDFPVWARLHPDTLVLEGDSEHEVPFNYVNGVNPYREYWRSPVELRSAIARVDDRFGLKQPVFGLLLADEPVVVPIGGSSFVHHTSAAGISVVVLHHARAAIALERLHPLTGEVMEFERSPVDWRGMPLYRDTTAEPSLWTFEGVALSGPAKGHRLAWVPAVSGFWFAWYAIYPESRVEIPGL